MLWIIGTAETVAVWIAVSVSSISLLVVLVKWRDTGKDDVDDKYKELNDKQTTLEKEHSLLEQTVETNQKWLKRVSKKGSKTEKKINYMIQQLAIIMNHNDIKVPYEVNSATQVIRAIDEEEGDDE